MRLRIAAFGLAGWVLAISASVAQQLPAITVTAPPAKKPAPAAKPSPSPVPPQSSAPPASPENTALQSLDPSANEAGKAQSGSQGVVSGEALQARPAYRVGELLEAMPGLVVTQHSGEGKANQYFLRGFNLDHGTDFAISVDGMPVNMRTHGHGQGYADLNFLIPELVRPHRVSQGSVLRRRGRLLLGRRRSHRYVDRLKKNFAQVESGSFGYRRAVSRARRAAGHAARCSYAVEAVHTTGPGTRQTNFRKLNGVMRYTPGQLTTTASPHRHGLPAMESTDQIPQRAVERGLISRFGTIDPTDGGDRPIATACRHAWTQQPSASGHHARGLRHHEPSTCFNNFTFFSNDPVNGDQFEQGDHRWSTAATASRTLVEHDFGDSRCENDRSACSALRRHRRVGLFNTEQRQRLSTVREDGVQGIQRRRLRREHRCAGRRSCAPSPACAAIYHCDVSAAISRELRHLSDSIVSPKLRLMFGPWAKTEFYSTPATAFTATMRAAPSSPSIRRAATGRTAHLARALQGRGSRRAHDRCPKAAEHACGVPARVRLPNCCSSAMPAPPRRAARAGASALSIRCAPGCAAPHPRSRCRLHPRPFPRGRPEAPGRRIPGAIEGVVSAALNFDHVWGGWYGGLRVRYFGPRPLIEDNSVRSKPSMPVSARLGYDFGDGLTVRVDVFNLLDEKSHQIDYYYASRLAFEPEAVDDIHFHPLEPRSLRLAVRKEF